MSDPRRQSVGDDGFDFDNASDATTGGGVGTATTTTTGAHIALATDSPAGAAAHTHTARVVPPVLSPPPLISDAGDRKAAPAPAMSAALPRGAALAAAASASAAAAAAAAAAPAPAIDTKVGADVKYNSGSLQTPLKHGSSTSTPSASQAAEGLVSASAFRQRKALGEPVVEIRDLRKSFTLEGRADVVHALRDIQLTHDSECGAIRRGEFVMIRGPSGGGKTTLLNIIGTIDEPTSGSVSIFGARVDAQSTDSYLAHLRLHKIGFVFQTFNLLATLSAYENVLLPMTIAGTRAAKDARARALQLLTLVGLADRMAHLPSELSGGEQQRVTIARALANDPELLLLDEPTGDLDTRNTVDIMDLLLRINVDRQTTCVMVTHNPDLECYADRILYVQDGAFKKQALNECQSRLDFDEYMKHLTAGNSTH